MVSFFFGDSFVGIFTLLKDKSVRVYKYKGSTLKGLTKRDNKNRNSILEVVNKYANINCCVFSFGQVDLHFSYYYKKVKEEKFMMKYMAEKYVEFIDGLPNCNNKILIGIYPSPVKDEDLYNQLVSYGIISKGTKLDSKYTKHSFRLNLFKKFNSLLKKECMKRKIVYVDIGDIVLDKKGVVKGIYKDPISKYNVHLLWEPLLPKILDKIKVCGIKKKYTIDLDKSLKKFIEEKKKLS